MNRSTSLRLKPKLMARRLWRARVEHRLWRALVERMPSKIPSRELRCIGLDVVEAGTDDGTPWIRLASGTVFYGLPSSRRHQRIFRRVRDRVPPALTPETFHLANEIYSRYYGLNYDGMPGPGGVVVEAGAYIGLKAVRFAELVAPTGRVIAIELMPVNARLLKRNVRANRLDEIITPVQAGLWNASGELVVKTSSSRGVRSSASTARTLRDQSSFQSIRWTTSSPAAT